MGLELPELVSRILTARGITGEQAIGEFFSPSLSRLAEPTDLPGVADAVAAIFASEGPVVVFGDYDCDGVCATAILVNCLKTIRPQVEVAPFLPARLTEGYGMTDVSVARLLREHPGVRLVITVDNGVNSVEQVAFLKARGLSVVVTDHHLPGPELPAADALVNPKVAAPEALSGLCGAGVAFLLAKALVCEAKRRGLYTGGNMGGPLLVMAGLATVTDIMPLVGQNRLIVHEALRHFQEWAPVGLRELLARAQRTGADRLTVKDFSFALGPRINAAGRVDSAMDALDLILESNRERARVYAQQIDLSNVKRKTVEQKMTDAALALVVPDAPAQLIDLPDGHPGVAGIVAARLMERLGNRVPVCVLAGGHGSARAPEGLNIRDAFEACSEFLVTYGGHAAAGGFSVREGCVDAFRDALCRYLSEHPVAAATRSQDEAEFWISPEDLSLELAEWIARMEPFGEGNREPRLGLRGIQFSELRTMGADGRHLQVAFRDRRIPRGVWWGHGDLVHDLRKDALGLWDVVFTVIISEYGERHAELNLLSIVKSSEQSDSTQQER